MKGLVKILLPILSTVFIVASCDKKGEKVEALKPDTTKTVVQQTIPEPKKPMSLIDSLLVYHDGCYTVQEGDNGVYGIAGKIYGKDNEVMGHALADWNNLELKINDKERVFCYLFPGMELEVKKVEIREVKPGDSWWSIAHSLGISVDEAQERFHWIGQIPNPGELYFVEKEVEKKVHRGGGGIISED